MKNEKEEVSHRMTKQIRLHIEILTISFKIFRERTWCSEYTSPANSLCQSPTILYIKGLAGAPLQNNALIPQTLTNSATILAVLSVWK